MGFFSKKMDKRISAYQRELIETHYREVDNMYRQIRGWRHDYRNHIQTMKAYAAEGDWEAIRRYLDLLDEDLTSVDTAVKTGNPMADAILNSKISLANSKKIRVIADAHIPVKLKSSEIDLCCILGNLFDNAIEASEKLAVSRRVVSVKARRIHDMLVIAVENNALPDADASGKTTKEDALFHGFGLSNIRAAVDKYDGQCTVKCKDGVFVLKIMIPMEGD